MNVDPERRYTVEHIKSHPWYQQVAQELHSGVIMGVDKFSADSFVLQQLEQFGLDKDAVASALESNKHNHMTTSYYLLKKKYAGNEHPRPPSRQPYNFSNTVAHIPQAHPKPPEGSKPAPPVVRTRRYLDVKTKQSAGYRIESTGGSSSRDQELGLSNKSQDISRISTNSVTRHSPFARTTTQSHLYRQGFQKAPPPDIVFLKSRSFLSRQLASTKAASSDVLVGLELLHLDQTQAWTTIQYL